MTLSQFFQASKNKESTNARSLGVSLINQLLKKELSSPRPDHREVIDDLASFCLEIGYASQITFSKLRHIVEKTLLAISQYTLIIDGLDECSDIADISGFIEALLSSDSKTLRCPKIILLSREHDGLKAIKEKCIAIAMDEIAVNPEIYRFISIKAVQHPQLQAIQKEMHREAEKSCHGSFLWASTMVECLVQPVRSEWEQLQRLKRIPAGIIDFFEDLVIKSGKKRSLSELILRREMFLILLSAQKSLTLDEFAVFLQFRHCRRQEKARRLRDIRNAVLDLCWPLVSVIDGYVTLYHMNAEEYLLTEEKNGVEERFSVHIKLEDSNATLAIRCLYVLSEEQNSAPGRIAYWIYKNTYPEYRVNAFDVAAQAEAFVDIVSYEYAARYLVYHLTRVTEPSEELLTQVDLFLRNFQFVKWAEYFFSLKGENTSFSELYGNLKSWWTSLPLNSKERLRKSVESFFTIPYRGLSVYYSEENQDKLLQYLCLSRLGAYYTLQIEIDAEYEVRREVAKGLGALLGPRNPLTLRAKTALGLCYTARSDFRTALKLYKEISVTQKEVLGLERQDYWSTLTSIAFVQFLMANFKEAATTMAELSAGWKSIPGLPTRFLILSNNLIEGYIYEARDMLGEAMNLYRVVWNDQTEIFGENNPMALYAQIGMGSIQRKQKEYKQAIENLDHAFQIRTQLWGLENGWVIDPAIQLIISYRENGEFDQAMARIELLSQCELLKRDFERKCQVRHLEALVLYDEEELEEQRLISDGAVLVGHEKFGESRRILQDLLHEQIEKGRVANNRSLLWIRLTLATLLRAVQRDDDVAPLFDEIVTPLTGGIASPQFEHVESPQLWKDAEKALRLVRDRKIDEADQELRQKGLRWVRAEDFWLFEGGPGVDTAWMKGP
jgi:tetratricopeptide (TPR) repeat protein